ncbi:ABC transporter ATP-binding protein [Stomatobaculum longum]|uniref:ABC transporter ATP-binding protein n=1 Tax=Stomatobaculum longum TaxID=796942 RepID=UPI0028061F99|nr:ABC transporter ATP-binding protein [Stomatobaculum longum]
MANTKKKANLGNITSRSMRRLTSGVLKDYGLQMLIVLVCVIAAAFADAYGMLFIQKLIDNYITPLLHAERRDFAPLLAALQHISLIYLISVVATYIYSILMVYVGQGTLLKIRKRLFAHMESLPISYFDTHAHGDIMSVYTNDTDTLRQLIVEVFPQLASMILSVITVLASMFLLHVPLTLIALVLTALMLFISGKVANISGKYFGIQQKELGGLNGYIEEMMEGQKVIKVFSHESQSIAEFEVRNQKLRDASAKANGIANVLMPIAAQLGRLQYVLIATVGAIFALNGNFGLSIGTLVAFMTLNQNFTRPITQITTQLNSVAMAAAGADRIYQLLDTPSEIDEGYVTLVRVIRNADGSLTETKQRTGLWAWRHVHQADGSVELIELEGRVELEHVDFGYVPEKTVLHDISLYAEKGQKIAFVGSTGAGKTTITNLINRFYEIREGKIRYDGINISKIKKADLRASLGIVLQDTNLFTGTVMENIRFGRLDATDEECIEAAKLANADGFINRLPDGYQTMLRGNGANLSQGQRQLLAIARAAVMDPPALILDEATSSIDSRTEQLVQRGMDSLMKGRTTFVIAHRLSTIKNADCIMVMEQGRIIERGNHDELLLKKGRYYRLYTGKQA